MKLYLKQIDLFLKKYVAIVFKFKTSIMPSRSWSGDNRAISSLLKILFEGHTVVK